MQVREIIEEINKTSPFDAACDWDNVGLLVGSLDWKADSVYLALDATDEVIDHAIAAGADVILTHHPMIFSPVNRVVADDFVGRRIIKLIENHIACIAMHTNYDIYGMAKLAADRLGLQKRTPLEVTSEDGSEGIGRVGRVAGRYTLKDYAEFVRDEFGLSHVRFFGDAGAPVKVVACTPGSGKSDIGLAIAAGADTFVTGDIDHHTGIDSVAKGLNIIDAGHYGIEHIFIKDEAKKLRDAFGERLTVTVEDFSEPISIV